MKKTALILIAALGLAACVTFSPQYKMGTRAELARDYEQAIKHYEKAALDNPREAIYRLSLQRARVTAGLIRLQQARRLAAAGKTEEAKAEYAKALEFNPRDTQAALELAALNAPPAPAAAPPSEKIEFPIKLKAKDEPIRLRVASESSLRSIFLSLGRTAGISIVFDEGFRDVPFTADISNQTFEQALRTLCQATKNFYRVLDERTAIVVPDQPLKRIQYEATCVRTFYLSNIVAQDAFGALGQVLRTQFSAPTIMFDKSMNSITLRGTAAAVDLAGRLLRTWDKPKGEVIIDLEIMEVSRSRLRQLGLAFDSNIIGLRYGKETTSAATNTWFGLNGLGLGKAENYTVSLPNAYIDLLETDADTKIIAHPRLRGIGDEKIVHKVGQKVPIPKTSFTPIAAGGYASQPITNFDFENVGLEINITPRIHFEREVTLDAEIKVTSLGGTGYADIPIINNREIKNVMRLKEGESQLIAGLLRDEERKAVSGIPGLKDIPGIGRLFGAEKTQLDQSDVIMTITPYIIRALPQSDEDRKPVWVDLDSASSGAGGVEVDEPAAMMVEDPRAALARRRPQEAGANVVAASPANLDVPAGREFRMAINVRSGEEIGALSLTVSFNPRVLQLKDAAEGALTRQFGAQTPFLKNIDNASGNCTIGFTSPQTGRGAKGGGNLASLVFEAKSAGESPVSIVGVSGMSATGAPIAFQTTESRVNVR